MRQRGEDRPARSAASEPRALVPAHAKLNLRLGVLGRERSGFHALETLFLRLDLADEVRVERTTAGLRLAVEGGEGVPDGPANLCWRAAELLLAETGESGGAAVLLRKRIPAAGGLGGGSADAAAVLVALNRQLTRPIDAAALVRLAGRLGSDVPFALCGSPMALGWERGRRLLPIEPPPPRPLLLAVPAEGVATAAAFGWLAEDREDGAEIDAEILPGLAALSRWESLERLARNDLEEPVFRRRPELRALRDALSDSGARLSLLCGSGSTVAAVFASDEERDAAAIALEGRIPARLLKARTLG